ncbi:MAG: DUF1801 domain-containing protein [Ekhidna sp.]|uniref:DUF1801 domain-containing protein n=1 Tax=Ekhidna sp. TaxID=2608089 RepID=UPI0032EC4AB5
MKTINHFILGLDGQQRAIVSYLHQRLTSDYDLMGKISYNVPFYYRKSWICYLNPLKDGGVELAFTRGNELSNDQGILDFKGRKQIAGIGLYSVADMPEQQIHEIIHEALILDETTKYSVRKSNK